MKFVLFIEGKTEKVVPTFLKRWLDVRLNKPVGIKPVVFEGWPQQWADSPKKANMHLNDQTKANDVIAVISLLDLYGPTVYPPDKTSVHERFLWAKEESEKRVDHPKFRQFFAVHETEAWLLSAPDLFPQEVKKALPPKIATPEAVNFDLPPAKLLDKLYKDKLKRSYKKVTDGAELFSQLDPVVAYNRCPI
jgi:hypothetical protein